MGDEQNQGKGLRTDPERPPERAGVAGTDERLGAAPEGHPAGIPALLCPLCGRCQPGGGDRDREGI